MHDSLRLELQKYAPNVNMLLVCPHAINTGMFDGILEAEDLGTRLNKALLPALEP